MAIETHNIKDLEGIFSNPFPESINIPWELKPRDYENTHYRYEMEIMAMLCRMQNPKIAFEFGTFEGFTSLVIARNTKPSARVFTLDLPWGSESPSSYDRFNASFVKCRYVLYFRGRPEERKIHQLIGDSATIDLSLHRCTMDLIFIDGCHQHSYIENDTKKAFDMLKKNGIIVWHDYNTTWPDVTPFLESLSVKKPLFHIERTNYVIHKTNEKE
ncbi:class I SAM-dependent methyltransferase [Candidatus Pacearchaeota archaeon]|nr:class I SAM-dependent methyltransferase [Candidatus Pacearchaeota archaeon]